MSDKQYLLICGPWELCTSEDVVLFSGALQECIDYFKRLDDESGPLGPHDPFGWATIVNLANPTKVVMRTELSGVRSYLWINPEEAAVEKAREQELRREFADAMLKLFPDGLQGDEMLTLSNRYVKSRLMADADKAEADALRKFRTTMPGGVTHLTE